MSRAYPIVRVRRALRYHGRTAMRLLTVVSAVLASAALITCSFDWDEFDPRLGTESGGAASTASNGGSGGGGSGGATTSTGGTGGSAQGGSGGVPLGPWSAPQLIQVLSDVEDNDDPSMTSDGLELYYNASRTGIGSDIWLSTRATRNDPWGAGSVVAELSSVDGETNHTVSPDGLTMFMQSDRGGNGHETWVATRPDRMSAWLAPTLSVELNVAGIGEVASITNDGLMILTAAAPAMGEKSDLYLVTRPTLNDPWETPVPIAELSTVDAEGEGWLHPDGTALVFGSDRPGGAGSGDLWFSERATNIQAFDPPVNLTTLNSMEFDSDPTLTPDLRYIVFAAAVPSMARELFEASR
jgi:hypothetical protein